MSKVRKVYEKIGIDTTPYFSSEPTTSANPRRSIFSETYKSYWMQTQRSLVRFIRIWSDSLIIVVHQREPRVNLSIRAARLFVACLLGTFRLKDARLPHGSTHINDCMYKDQACEIIKVEDFKSQTESLSKIQIISLLK